MRTVPGACRPPSRRAALAPAGPRSRGGEAHCTRPPPPGAAPPRPQSPRTAVSESGRPDCVRDGDALGSDRSARDRRSMARMNTTRPRRARSSGLGASIPVGGGAARPSQRSRTATWEGAARGRVGPTAPASTPTARMGSRNGGQRGVGGASRGRGQPRGGRLVTCHDAGPGMFWGRVLAGHPPKARLLPISVSAPPPTPTSCHLNPARWGCEAPCVSVLPVAAAGGSPLPACSPLPHLVRQD